MDTNLKVEPGCLVVDPLPVQCKTCRFLSTTTDQSFYIAGMLVDHTHGRLWLRCEIDTLCKNFTSVGEYACLIFVYISLSIFRNRTRRNRKSGIPY